MDYGQRSKSVPVSGAQHNGLVDAGTVWKTLPFHEPILWRHVSWGRQSPEREIKEQCPWGWLGEWLKALVPRFSSRFGPATLLLPGSVHANSTRVRANSFLLETVFGNVWANATQASEEADGNGCRITAELTVMDSWLQILLYDDGPGFSEQQLDAAFRVPFSTKAERRGQGLLEIAEAVGRLQGDVQLVAVTRDEYRIRLPVDPP